MTTSDSNEKQHLPHAPDEKKGSLLWGLAISIGLPLLSTFGLIRESEPFVMLIVFIGLSQLIYLIPLAIYFHRKKAKGTVQGLLIGGGIIFLINASCFGLLTLSLGNMH